MPGRHDMLNCYWMTQEGLWPKTNSLLLKCSLSTEKRWWKSKFRANVARPHLLVYKLHKQIHTGCIPFQGSVTHTVWGDSVYRNLIYLSVNILLMSSYLEMYRPGSAPLWNPIINPVWQLIAVRCMISRACCLCAYMCMCGGETWVFFCTHHVFTCVSYPV